MVPRPTAELRPITWTCDHCGEPIADGDGWLTVNQDAAIQAWRRHEKWSEENRGRAVHIGEVMQHRQACSRPGDRAMTSDILKDTALAYADAGWAVFPLSGKFPKLECPVNRQRRLSGRQGARCKGACGHDGHGVLDATTDAEKVAEWWSRYPACNIGARVPDQLIVIDTDPRHNGEANLQALAAEHSPVPATLTCFSGREDGGRHRYLLHPGGNLGGKRLPVGVDLKKRTGYVLLPPSLHPTTGRPYRWDNPTASIAPTPGWLAELLKVAPPAPRSIWKPTAYTGDSIIAWFNANTSWASILTGWTEISDGRWLHPKATSALSATVEDDRLYVYTPNTEFDQTEEGDPRGYDKFAAWALLEHHNDTKAAARASHRLRGDPERGERVDPADLIGRSLAS